jgi:hypothetical protein
VKCRQLQRKFRCTGAGAGQIQRNQYQCSGIAIPGHRYCNAKIVVLPSLIRLSIVIAKLTSVPVANDKKSFAVGFWPGAGFRLTQLLTKIAFMPCALRIMAAGMQLEVLLESKKLLLAESILIT